MLSKSNPVHKSAWIANGQTPSTIQKAESGNVKGRISPAPLPGTALEGTARRCPEGGVPLRFKTSDRRPAASEMSRGKQQKARASSNR